MEMADNSSNVHVLEGGEGAPPEPDWAMIYQEDEEQQRARRHWREIVAAIREAGGLAVSNGDAIERLVAFRMEFRTSWLNVAENGLMLPGTKRKAPMVNPHYRLMRSTDESIRQLESELGIAPVRRHRIGKVARKIAKPRPSDAYLGRRHDK